MSMTVRAVLAAAVLAAASTTVAHAGDGGGWDYAGPPDYCRDSSRACVLEAADSYFVAMRAHDGDLARLAPMIKRTRNASEQTPETQWYTADEMADSLDEHEKPVTAVHSIDWVIDGNQAVAFYAIDASYEERGHQVAQTWLAERFRITNGEIDEIEAVFFFAPGVGNTSRGWTTASTNGGQPATDRNPAWCTDASRGCVAAAAQSYLAAQLSGDHGDARLSDDARRTFNGRVTGVNRATVEAGDPPSASAYQARDARWYVDVTTGDAVVIAALDQAPAGTGHAATLLFAQRLRVTNGLVHEIEQIGWPIPGGSPHPTGWES